MSGDGKNNSERRRQKHAATDYEKSPRNKNREVEKCQTKVGHRKNDRTGTTEEIGTVVPTFDEWIKQQTREIPQDQEMPGEDRV